MAERAEFEGCFTAHPSRLKEIRAAVRAAATAAGADEACASDIVIAVDEACQNIIRHGYEGDEDGTIEVCVRHEGDELVLTIRDFAPLVDPDDCQPRSLDEVRPGGLGTHFMREVMDSCEYGQPATGGGNLLTMRKRIGAG